MNDDRFNDLALMNMQICYLRRNYKAKMVDLGFLNDHF